MNDVTASHIDTVMGETTTRRDEVRAQRWFFICGQESIARAESAELPVVVLRVPGSSRPSKLVLIGSVHCVSSW